MKNPFLNPNVDMKAGPGGITNRSHLRFMKESAEKRARQENINKCLQSLVSVNDWDVCPFCGRNQRSNITVLRPHDDDCPVKLASDIIKN
jgi:hypothetical protein